ncbi:hypothetical protein ACFP6B_05440 [Rothia nasimurium]|uniref:hypothetical protein n=1 Tax=Rothia nasimurium TaxID=85336 RepID=UPI00361CE29D
MTEPSETHHHVSKQNHQYNDLPLNVRIRLSHAHLQYLATVSSSDILHIKGYIYGPDTYPTTRASSDVDLLVRPEHVEKFVESTVSAGWQILTTFETGSDYHHAMTIYHPTWGLADIHRAFPGIGLDATQAFNRLWEKRRIKTIANVECLTTSLTDSRIIVYVHAARSTSKHKPDVEYLNKILSWEEKKEIEKRVAEIEADLAFAAATGTIEKYSKHPDYLFWKTASQETSNITRWYARIKNAPSLQQKIKTIFDIFLVNQDHLAMELGHQPTRQEVRQKFFTRFKELTKTLRKKGK